jgi:hypothetical protein
MAMHILTTNDGLSSGSSETTKTADHPTRNLLIVHTPPYQALSDWLEVKQRIETRAPDIEVRIATNGSPNSVTRRWQVGRPSLVISVCPLNQLEPKGGRVYAGRFMSKLEQIEQLAAMGLPVPRTAMLTPQLALDDGTWGRYVVVKPLHGMQGREVRVVRAEDVVARHSALTLDGRRPMIVQPYIEHAQDGYPTEHRVLTMFGRVLYAARNRWGAPRRPLEEIVSDPNGVIASNDKSFGRVRAVCSDPEIISLGERAHAAFPERPTLGVDIIRNAATGELCIMEVNPEGLSWHFSSMLSGTFTPEHRRDVYAQYNALDRVAELLIERTRAEAS